MKRIWIILGVLLVCGALAVPVEAGGKGWHLRVFAAGFDPSLDVTVPSENPDEVQVKGFSDLGFGASLEYQFNDRFGIELGAFTASPEIELGAEIPGYGQLLLTDSMSARAVTLDFDIHLTPNSTYFDVYIGGGVANMSYGDLHYVDPEGDPLDISADGELTWSVKAGLDIALGKESGWAAVGGIRYIPSDIELGNVDNDAGDKATLSYNIFSFTVGIAFSF